MPNANAKNGATSGLTGGMVQKFRDAKSRLHYRTLFKLKTWIRRKLSRAGLISIARPGSSPFITGDGFRSIADHVFDEIETVIPARVAPGDIVFVRADFLHDFFKKIHPRIQNKYVLVSHNSDQNIGAQFLEYIDEKIIHWFAQNVLVKHEKITPLPIGLILRMYDPENKTANLIEKYRATDGVRSAKLANKDAKIYYSFSAETNPVRAIALDHLAKNPASVGNTKLVSKDEYFERMSACMFNASPEGNGADCHSTWESIYVGTVPIVTRNPSTEYWFDKGLPLHIIDSWSDIDMINADSLSETYASLKDRFNSPLPYMEYWIHEILEKRNMTDTNSIQTAGELPERALITSASDKFFPSLLNLIGSLKANYPNHPTLYVYDLGLNSIYKKQLIELGIELRTVPPFVDHWRSCYTWKTYILKTPLARLNFYIDAGCQILKSLDALFDSIDTQGYVLVSQGHDVLLGEVTPDSYFNIFDVDGEFKKKEVIAAGLFGFKKGHEDIEKVTHGLYDAGTMGLCLGFSKGELWKNKGKNKNLFVRDCDKFRHDTTVISLLVYKHIQNPVIESVELFSGEQTGKDSQYLWNLRMNYSNLQYASTLPLSQATRAMLWAFMKAKRINRLIKFGK